MTLWASAVDVGRAEAASRTWAVARWVIRRRGGW
jgi:hypothetical protein